MKTCPQCKMRYPNEAVFCFVDGGDLIVLKDKRIGTTIAGRYQIEEVIGEGGMATVYRATQMLTDRSCAIKVMNASFAKEATVRERFRREAKNAQKLAHPNIIEIFDQGDTEDGTAYIAMEILQGKSLAEVVGDGAMEIPRALSIMVQITRGIARAHDLGVIHRDIKPENIFLQQAEGAEIVKLLDFGIALSKQDSRLTGTGEIFGTPQYMAPERITAGDPGPAADIYSLGILYYEMLTGKLPFDAPDIATFFQMHLKQAPAPPTKLNPLIPVPLEALILRMLAKAPKDRPVDAHRVHADLVELAREADLTVPSVPESEAHTTRGREQDSQVALSRPARDAERWKRRVQTFEKMFSEAYGNGIPSSALEELMKVRALVPKLTDLHKEIPEAQRALSDIAEKGREGRQRFGFAVDALGLDASKAKDEVRVVDAHFNVVKARTEQAGVRYAAAQKDIIFWEGRCGFQEPTMDLAQAYRTAGNIIESWMKAKEEERRASALREANERAASDLEFQIQALRTALAAREKEADDEQREAEEHLMKLTAEAAKYENEFITHAMRVCEPLRMMPELWPMFESMESDAA
jgi:serine/threonine-protein kinase